MTTPRPSKIEGARKAVADAITALDFVQDGSVVEFKAGNMEAKFDEALAKASGLAVLVGIRTALESGSQATRIEWKPIELFVDVYETALHQADDTAPPGAWAVAEELVAALKLVSINDEAFPQLADKPLEQIGVDSPGDLVVRFYLHLSIAGNSRT